MKKKVTYVNPKRRIAQKVFVTLFGTLFGVMVVGTDIAMDNESTISAALGQPDYELVQKENSEGPKELFESEFKSIREVVYNGYQVQLEEAKEGTVLLKNNGALPLAKGSKVSLFGIASAAPFYGASGSGGINTKEAISWYDAFAGKHYEKEDPKDPKFGDPYFQVNEKLKASYTEWTGKTSDVNASSNVSNVKIGDVTWDQIAATEGYADIPTYGDAAFMIIKRTGGEGYDLPATTGKNEQYGNLNNATAVNSDGVNGDYLQLSETEKSILSGLKAMKAEGKVKKIVLILNMASTIQLDFLKNDVYDIDACLWTGAIGEFGAEAITKLLVGEWNFSGGLSTTLWANHLNNPVNSNFTDQNYFK